MKPTADADDSMGAGQAEEFRRRFIGGRESRMKTEWETEAAQKALTYNPPWSMKPLNEWNIVGMNHYHLNGEKRLFVAMTKGDKCIKEEGPDDAYFWNRLWHKAVESDR